MGISNFIWNAAYNIGLILRNEPPQSKKGLLLTYLKLRLKYLLSLKLLKFSNEKIFGFKVRFFDYPSFILLFEEIFIKKDYYLNTKASSPVIIDCGSNIGMALLFFKKLYPGSKIIAFEPDKKTFEILKENVETNKLKYVEVVNKAVYNSEGTIDFYYDPDHPGSLWMSVEKERLPKACGQVDSVLLSNYVRGRVDFLKMDIEGAEYLVIEELSHRNKLKLIKEMVIEYHHHIKPADDNFSKILKILEENGFGYQISTFSIPQPLNKKKFQDISIYAYKK